MLYYVDSAGVIQAAIPGTVAQGSVGVNEIVLIAPFPISTVVSALITLPNGLKIYPQYVGRDDIAASDYPYKFAPVTAFEGKIPTPDGVTVNVWKMSLDRALTQVSGNLHITFLFTDAFGHTLTSTLATLNVLRASPYLAPTVTEEDITTIQRYLAAAEAAYLATVDLLNEAGDRFAYDHVITTEEEFLNLNTYEGRILVKGVELTANCNVTVNANAVLLDFEGCTVNADTSIGIRINGHRNCTIRKCTFDGPNYDTVYISAFGYVDKCGATRYTSYTYTNCDHIYGSVITGAYQCRFIDNCDLYSEIDAEISNCSFINGIAENDAYGSSGVVFDTCLFISNVFAVGSYIDCLYVDNETCRGYVPAADAGKVRVLTTDGSYQAIRVVEKIAYSNNVYATDAGGNSTTIPYNAQAQGNAIVRRTADGNIILPTTQSDGNQAVPKSYVDTAISAIETNIATAINTGFAQAQQYLDTLE